MDLVVATPSGCRVRFRTSATAISVEAKLTHVQLAHERLFPAVFELISDGVPIDRREVSAGDVFTIDLRDPARSHRTSGDGVAIEFHGLGSSLKDIELWLPHQALVELRRLRVAGASGVDRPTPAGPTWIHHGSSISQCREAVEPTGTWPALVARQCGMNLVNLGFGGQCHLDQFVARTIRDLPAQRISLELGINVLTSDSMQERVFVSAVHGFLDTIRDGHPTTPLLVVSPIACPPLESHPGPLVFGPDDQFVISEQRDIRPGSLTAAALRDLLQSVVSGRRSSGDANLEYLDGRTLLGADETELLVDALHPGAAGYRLMADRFARIAFGNGWPSASS